MKDKSRKYSALGGKRRRHTTPWTEDGQTQGHNTRDTTVSGKKDTQFYCHMTTI